MKDRLFKVKLYLYSETVYDDIVFYQNDTKSCALKFEFYEKGKQAYDLKGKHITITIAKGTEKEVVDIVECNNGEYLYILPRNVLDLVGNYKVTVQGYDDDYERITFDSFKYKVNKSADGKSITDDSNYPVLTGLIGNVREISNAENLRKDVEIIRVSSETNRKNAEATRVDGEKYRVNDYNSLKRIMLDENQAANLQNQVNTTNSQLAEKANQVDVDDLKNNKANSNELEVERNRINNLVSNAGNTDGNSELLDVRLDSNGTNHGVSGDAIRFAQDGRLLNYDSMALSLGYRKFLELPFEYGSINPVNGANSTDIVSVRTPINSLITFNGDIRIINTKNTLYRWKWYMYTSSGIYENNRGWETNPNLLISPDTSKKYRLQIATLDGSTINITNALKNIKIVYVSDFMEVTLDDVLSYTDYILAIGGGESPVFIKNGNNIEVTLPSTSLFYRDANGVQIKQSSSTYYNQKFIVESDKILVWNITNNTIVSQSVNAIRDKKNLVLIYNLYGNVQSGAFKGYYDNQIMKTDINNVKTNSIPNITFISRQGEIGGYPENSLVGIKYACVNGYKNVRVSVNLTSDGIPVLFHDIIINRLARNADGTEITEPLNIRELTLEQVNSYDWGRFSGKEELYGMDITTLEQFVKYAKYKGIKIRLELKQTYTNENVDSILNILLKYGMINYTTISSDVKEVLDLFYNKCICIDYAYIGHFNTALVDKALVYKNLNNNVSIDIYPADYDLLATSSLLYAKNNNIKIKLGSVGNLTDLYKWFETGVDELEVAYITNPIDKVIEYYNN